MATRSLEEEVGLREGECLKRLLSRTAGYMECDDITEYSILDAFGNQVGRVAETEHTDIKAPFAQSRKVDIYRS
jgi:hypothetical protein